MCKCFCSQMLLNFAFHLAQVLGALWLCLLIKARWSSFGSCLSLVQKWDVAVFERKIEKQKAVAAGVGRGAEFLSFPAPSPVQAQQHLDVPLVMAALGIQSRLLWKAVVSFIKQYLESAWWIHCTVSIALWDTCGNWAILPRKGCSLFFVREPSSKMIYSPFQERMFI